MQGFLQQDESCKTSLFFFPLKLYIQNILSVGKIPIPGHRHLHLQVILFVLSMCHEPTGLELALSTCEKHSAWKGNFVISQRDAIMQ